MAIRVSDKMTELMLEDPRPRATHLAEGNAVTPMMMSPMDFTGMKSTAALIAAVVQTNLRATQELLRAGDPQALLELQQRFAREYTAALMQGTMTLVDSIRSAAG